MESVRGMPGTATMRKVRIVLIPSPLVPSDTGPPRYSTELCAQLIVASSQRPRGHAPRTATRTPMGIEEAAQPQLPARVAPAPLSPTVRSSHRVDKLNIRCHPAHGARTRACSAQAESMGFDG